MSNNILAIDLGCKQWYTVFGELGSLGNEGLQSEDSCYYNSTYV